MKDDNSYIGGVYHCKHLRNGVVIDEWEERNLVVNEGLAYILRTKLTNSTAPTPYFIGLYANNYTPTPTDTIGTFPTAGVAGEISVANTVATNRPVWVGASPTIFTATNIASPAIFVFKSNTILNGAFLASTGALISAIKFSSTKSMIIDDGLSIVYSMTSS
jgi:hypothetical protein